MKHLVAPVFVLAVLTGPASADLVISTAATGNMTCSAGVCTAMAKNATLSTTDLTNMLASDDVTVSTGTNAAAITVADSFSWTNTSRLTLEAKKDVSFRAPVTVAGPGALTVTTGPKGGLVFLSRGSADFWDMSSSLIVNGTPYTLVDDIQTLAAGVAANPSGAYALAKDYDAKPDGRYSSDPIGTLSGPLEGLGHTVSRLHVATSAGGAAFINAIAQQGAVHNLALVHASMNGVFSGPAASILALTNAGSISHVDVEGKVTAKDKNAAAAGLVVTNTGTIDGSSASGSVDATHAQGEAGGLVDMNNGIIGNSHASNTVTATFAGGFVMDNGGNISLSSASGAVTASGKSNRGTEVGGFLVGNFGNIDRSFATGNVDGGSAQFPHAAFAGGFAMVQSGSIGSSIANSYATGAVSVGSGGVAGGFAYQDIGTLTTSWSSGAVSSADPDNAEGFVYATPQGAANDYWDTDTSGQSHGCFTVSCPGVTGLTTAQFQSGLPAGFDPSVWAENAGINNGYPYLLANPPQ